MLRPAAPLDHPAVADICRASDRTIWGEEALTTHPSRLALVAVVGAQIIGVAKTHLHAEPDIEAPAGHYLGGVVVHPQWRGRGIGKSLTSARLDWIWERAEHAYYFTNENNGASIRLHAKLGFTHLTAAPTIRGVSADDGKSNLVLFELSRPGSGIPA